MTIELIQLLLVAAFVAVSASLLGSFAVLKRMALVGDAMSHVALPGLAIALLFNFNPFIGALVFLVVASFGVWFLEYHSDLPIETIVGVFFTASLAIGALLIPEHELLETLFGDITALSRQESIILIVSSIILTVLILMVYKKLTLNMISQEISQSIGVKNSRLELLYLLIFSLVVALGIRFVGALLMGSLVIIPAASAKNLSRSLHKFMILSVIFGVFAAVAGMYISYIYQYPPGPVFIIISSAIFILSLFVRFMSKK